MVSFYVTRVRRSVCAVVCCVTGHDFIGSAMTSVDDLAQRSTSGERIPLVNSALKAKKKGYLHSGLLRVNSFVVTPRPSFLDYITGGLELSFMVAIDFTGVYAVALCCVGCYRRCYALCSSRVNAMCGRVFMCVWYT
jgi:hypothetical protein